jgi:hypothetical protein
MARVSAANMTKKDPTEWVVGARAARAARTRVASQLTELISTADLTGSPEFVARRIADYAESIRHGDPSAQRAALMEVAVAAATTAAALDVRYPATAG